MATYKYLGDQGADGTIMGKSSSEPLAFYGGTPTTRQTAPTAVATTVAASTASSWGYTTSTQANAVVTAVNDIITVLTNLGLVA